MGCNPTPDQVVKLYDPTGRQDRNAISYKKNGKVYSRRSLKVYINKL